MIALDTNVLVRFLVRDDERQSALAAKLINRSIADDALLFVSNIVVCELVWVLTVSYDIRRADIADMLRDLFRARHLEFSRKELLARALASYTKGKGDFADYLIGEHARAAGYDTVKTFDRVLHREPGFASLT